MELYIKNISRRWRKEVAAVSENKYVFSPYITSSTAESVLSQTAGNNCEIYTVFSAELFSSKASSLKTIKKLKKLGHKIFHLPNLHAKIVLMPGVFASIGSQNLTHGGTKNKEASIAIRNKKVTLQIERQILPWLQERIPITAEMISDMENLLGGIEPIYEEARLAAEEADRQVVEAQAQRDAEARLAKEMKEKRQAQIEEKRRKEREAERRLAEVAEQQRREQEAELQRKRYRQLQANIDNTAKSLTFAYGVVRRVPYDDWRSSSCTKSLMVQNGKDLISWTINNIPINLVRTKRYLLLLDSGKIGWARVVKTRITFVGKGVSFSESISIKRTNLLISANGDWSSEPYHGRNVSIEVKDVLGNDLCVISAWFDLNSLDIIKIASPESQTLLTSEQSNMVNIISNNIAEFKGACLKRLTAPFDYKKHLYGEDVETFFNNVGSGFYLKAALIGTNPILIGKPA